MTNLQTLARELRERISHQRRTWALLAAPTLAGALPLVEHLLLELGTLADRVEELDKHYHELVQLIRSADVIAHARDLDSAGFLP